MNVRTTTILRFALLAIVGLCVLMLPGCSSDSPSEPAPTGGGGAGGGGGGGSNFTVTVTASPTILPAGGTDPSLIQVQVRQANGAPPANGTTVVVTTTLGSLGTPGGQNSVALSLTNGNGAIQLFPGTSAGLASVQAQIQGSVGVARVEFREAETFFVSFIDPGVGLPAGGDTVTVNGGGFVAPVRVTFGGINAQVLSVSSNRIRVVTPPSPNPGNAQAVVNIVVTIGLNTPDQATDNLSGGFTYSPGGETEIPTVFSVTPSTGPNEGGTLVTLAGSGFQAPLQVVFGQGGSPDAFTGQEAEIRSVSPTRLEVLTPAATGFGQNNQNASVDVLVRNLDSGLASIRPSSFRYGSEVLITSVGPGSTPYFGGDLVTVFGQGFDAPVAVGLAGFAQSVRSVTGTEIVVETSAIVTDTCDDVSGGASVTNIETGDNAEINQPIFTYLVELFSPVATFLDPTFGPQGGGTLVTIRGANLRDLLVTLGERPAEIISVNADFSEIEVRTPFLPTELLGEEACDDNNDGTAGTRYVPTAVDLQVVNRATTCQFSFPDAFVYNPSNSSCRGDTAPPPPPSN